MFAKDHRLRSDRAINNTLKKGVSSVSGALKCVFIATNKTPRLCVIAGLKVDKKAVDRNLLKRRTRAALRELGLPPGDLVVLWRSGASGIDFENIKSHLEQCLKKINHP